VVAVIEARPDAAGTVTITFRLPAVVGADRINVVGEFNRWSNVADAMERGDDGFVARIALPVGRTYRFRYLLDGIDGRTTGRLTATSPTASGATTR
jgi:hypothetical protein